MPHATPRLFQPVEVGQMELKHRVVLAPMTRVRADKHHVPNLPVMKEYYAQRATTPGTFLITESTLIAPQAGGQKNVPGIYSNKQVKMWKEVRLHTTSDVSSIADSQSHGACAGRKRRSR